VPFDHVRAFGCDLVMAVEVTGHPRPGSARPGVTELALGATQIMQLRMAALMRRIEPPDVWIDPPVDDFRAYDFLKARDILAAAEPVRDEVKQRLSPFLG